MSDARQQVLREVEVERATGARVAAEVVESTSTRASQGYLLLAGTSLLLALVLALAAARSITRPLRELTEAADHLAEDRLPKLVDALRNPADDDEHYLSAAMEPIEVRADDELGHLAHAFNLVQSVAVDVAAEQATLLKKGISELYVNLARRNQALLDRQIQHLDELERDEQDTEVLEHLYLLDHLATRMRRNAESLLVLAGAESGPRRIEARGCRRRGASGGERGRGVPARGSRQPGLRHAPRPGGERRGPPRGRAASRTPRSSPPPESMVRVDGARTGGSYQLVISDQGVGMRAEQLEQLNDLLHDPPVTGLALGRSLGCLVAARLAARHGITVRLRAAEGDGVAAHVTLPRHLLVAEAAEPLVPTARPAVAPAPPVRPPLAERLDEALPATDFDAGLQALLAEEDAAGRAIPSPPHRSRSGIDPDPPRSLEPPPRRCPSRSSSRPSAATPTRCAPCCPVTDPAWRPGAASTRAPWSRR